MDEKTKEEREFQYVMTKIQVDFEYWIAFAIGIIAILYGLLPYYQNSILMQTLDVVLIAVAFIFLIRIYYKKEERFAKIRKKYIGS